MACFVGFAPLKSHRKEIVRAASLCVAFAGSLALLGYSRFMA